MKLSIGEMGRLARPDRLETVYLASYATTLVVTVASGMLRFYPYYSGGCAAGLLSVVAAALTLPLGIVASNGYGWLGHIMTGMPSAISGIACLLLPTTSMLMGTNEWVLPTVVLTAQASVLYQAMFNENGRICTSTCIEVAASIVMLVIALSLDLNVAFLG